MSEINLKKNILMSGSFRIVIMVIAVLTGWVSTRYLGVVLKGQYSYLMTSASFIWMMLGLGIYQSYPYVLRKQAHRLDDMFQWSLLQYIVELILFIGLGLGFMDTLIIRTGIPFSPFLVVVYAVYIATSKYSMQMQMLYLGLDRIFQNSLMQFLRAFISFLVIGCGWFFFRDANRLAYVITAILGADLLCVIYYTAALRCGNIFHKIDFKFILQTYGMGIKIFFSSFFILLLIRSDILLIKRFLAFRDVGVYSIAANIVDMLQLASNLVGSLLLVKLSDSDNEGENWIVMKKVLTAFIVLLTVANLGFIIFGKFLITTLYGIDFEPSYYVYLWLIPASFGLSFGSLFNTYLWSKGFPLISILMPAIALLTNVLLNLFLIPLWGINGAAISTSIAYLLWFGLIVVYEQKVSGGRFVRNITPGLRDWTYLYQSAMNTINKILRRKTHVSVD